MKHHICTHSHKYLYSVSKAMATDLGDSPTQRRDYEAQVLFIYLFFIFKSVTTPF